MPSAPKASVRAALVVLAALSAVLGAPEGRAAGPRLRNQHLFDSLAANPVSIHRLEGEWSAGCDSAVLQGASALDCFVRLGEVLGCEDPYAYVRLVGDLMECTWIRSATGWVSPAPPTLGFVVEVDSGTVDLLVSLRAMKATISSPFEGSSSCVIPERLYGEIAWCLWALDPENPDVAAFVRDELRRKGMDPDTAPPEDFAAFLNQVLPQPEAPARESPTSPPQPYRQVDPEYPNFALAVGIEGTVVLDVLVDADGSVRDIQVVHSVPGLDTAARTAVRRWLFRPAMRDGKAVDAWVEVSVPFRLPEVQEHQP